MKSHKTISIILGVISLMASFQAMAQFIDLEAVNAGIYQSTGTHDAGVKVVYVGDPFAQAGGSDREDRSFLVFDIPKGAGPVSSATIELSVPLFLSDNPSEQINLYEVATPIDQLVAGHDAADPRIDIFTDLGSGELYGNGSVSGDNLTLLISLTQAAIQNLDLITRQDATQDAPTELFAIGLAAANPGNWGALSQNLEPGAFRMQLNLVQVPEPGGLFLLLTGLLGLGLSRQR